MSTVTYTQKQGSRDLDKEESDRDLVVRFYEKVFVERDVVGGSKALADGYVQHNPMVPNGKRGFVTFFKEIFSQQPGLKARIIRVATNGDCVWVNAHFTTHPEDRGFLVVDIFRVEDGVLVEHWDVMQEVPEVSLNPLF